MLGTALLCQFQKRIKCQSAGEAQVGLQPLAQHCRAVERGSSPEDGGLATTKAKGLHPTRAHLHEAPNQPPKNP